MNTTHSTSSQGTAAPQKFDADRDALCTLTRALLSQEQVQQIEATACQAVGEHLNADRVLCLRARAGQGFAPLTIDYCRGLASAAPTLARAALGLEVLSASESGRPLLIHSIEEASSMPESMSCMQRLDAAALAAVPWSNDEQVVLMFVLHQTVPRRWTEEDVAFVQQVAERAALAIRYAERHQSLRLTTQRKDAFLATLAHELRNPLTPIRHGLALLRHGAREPAEVSNTLEVMERHLLHLVRLVDDLSDGSRISRGLVKLNRRQVDLVRIVRTALETSHHAAQIQGRQVSVRLCPGPVVVHADGGRLVQVVSNLLSNALKHTRPEHRIWIELEATDECAHLVVRDDGPGIAPDVLPRVFDLFVQADPTKSSGLGLGLSLVRDLVRLHGGDVEVRSAGVGQGCEFKLWLPLSHRAVSHSEPPEAARSAPPEVALSGRALIVDDNEDAAETLRLLLKLSGIDAETAYDGPAALEAFDRFKPDVVYLDIGMPGMDGYEVARRLRQKERGPSVVIVALTGWAQERERKLTRASGFDHHLVKPVSLQDVTGIFQQSGASV